jgi:hypothetical protein
MNLIVQQPIRLPELAKVAKALAPLIRFSRLVTAQLLHYLQLIVALDRID